MRTEGPDTLRMVVYSSLMVALTVAGAYIAIRIGPVPIVLQNLFILLTGLLLGWRWGLASVALYLGLGALGLPVFAEGGGGLGHFAGPTGGYLLGYLPAVALVGLISQKGTIFLEILALVVGALVVYAAGVPWLMWRLGTGLRRALEVGFFPFLIVDALKIAAAFGIARGVRPLMNRWKGR
jgi:biotin transport system substrate-specific component